ncbi:AroM family protein [Virgibacillus sp. L01]|uniref:AroM family protein n=1 Tax=Virgibacillus sp. L01 TaxID=3457429 RepID=UPI003FD33B46
MDISAIPTTCSPYNFREADLVTAARQLNELPAHAIILDCMGYTQEMKAIVQKYTFKKVLLSRNVIFLKYS